MRARGAFLLTSLSAACCAPELLPAVVRRCVRPQQLRSFARHGAALRCGGCAAASAAGRVPRLERHRAPARRQRAVAAQRPCAGRWTALRLTRRGAVRPPSQAGVQRRTALASPRRCLACSPGAPPPRAPAARSLPRRTAPPRARRVAQRTQRRASPRACNALRRAPKAETCPLLSPPPSRPRPGRHTLPA